MRRPVRSQVASRAETRRIHYLAVEGPPGAGKTALARELSGELNGRLVADEAGSNPFLSRFHRDPQGWAFRTQLFFTLSRYAQQRELEQQDLFRRLTVSDYLFVKDRIYATLTLEDRELMLYERLRGLIEPDIPRPDLVLYLQTDVEALLARRRAPGDDRPPDRSYLAAVVEAYNYYFLHYEETPLLVVNTRHVDLSTDREAFNGLVAELTGPAAGTRFFNPRAPS